MTDTEIKMIKAELNRLAAKDKFSNICESALRLVNLYETIILGNQVEIAELKKELNEARYRNSELEKKCLIWHKVHIFDKPNENGWITNDAPAYDNREYLVKTKRRHHSIQELMKVDTGVVFEDYEWEEVDAWAELPEV